MDCIKIQINVMDGTSSEIILLVREIRKGCLKGNKPLWFISYDFCVHRLMVFNQHISLS